MDKMFGWEVKPEKLSDDSTVYNVVSVANPSIVLHAANEEAADKIYTCLMAYTVD